MEPNTADLQAVAVAASNPDNIQTSESTGNLAQSIQALFASSDAASQLQLLQAVGAVPPASAAPMVILPASVGNSSVMTGSWPQQYVVVPGLNQFVLTASDANSSSTQAVLLASLGAQAQVAGHTSALLTSDIPVATASPSPHTQHVATSPAHIINGVTPIVNPSSALSTIAENQLSQPQNLPKPPVKPLSAYMSFSKAIWPQVKMSHANASVCEIGAIIGQMWNDLEEAEKKRYNDNYAIEKAKYTKDLQAYLQATGLKASDLVKPKSRKGRVQGKASASAAVSASSADDAARGALPHFSQVWATAANSKQLTNAAGIATAAAHNANTLYSDSGRQVKSAAVPATTQSDVGVESELRDLREAVSNVTREAEFLKRQLNEAFAYIRQLEEQQASVLSELATANSAAAAANAAVQTPSVGAV